jgi:transposase
MIEREKRDAIYCLHKEGKSIGKIVRLLNVSRNTVRKIIKQEGSKNMPDSTREDKIVIDEKLLRRLHKECDGWIERVHQKLGEEEGITIGYSTLTRLLRELGLGGRQSKNKRCAQVPDTPGEEMQHDTSPYTLKIGGKSVKVVCSILYFRYSKVRYVKFYRSFNRFNMKCFLHEGLTFFAYSASFCIIDNTNLARLRGSGKNAVMVPEMEQFARQYGFVFVCHEIGHSNRKAGNERSFYTVESNFFPGRTFESLEDLNQQAFEWSTVRMLYRPVSKTRLIPAKAFEHEQRYLKSLPPYVQPPYIDHKRKTDQYGYISFDGNYYWIPGTRRDDVKVLQYSDCIKIYHRRNLLVQYKLPPGGVKNQQFSPQGNGAPKPQYKPKYRKKPTASEEKKLRGVSKEVEAYLDFAFEQNQNQNGKQKHRFIRQLYWLYQKMAAPLFIKALNRALKYRVTDIETIERIAVLLMREGSDEYKYKHSAAVVEIDENFQDRESYLEGRFSDEVDCSRYDKMMEDEHEHEHEDEYKDEDKDKD